MSKNQAEPNPLDASRVERLLAFLLLEQMEREPQTRKVQVLNFAGFTNAEIAALLQTTPAVIAQRLYEARSTSGQTGGRGRRRSSSTAKRR